MSKFRLKKSTIGRIRLTAVRAGFRAAEVIAPALGAKVAASLWFKTPRQPRAVAVPDGGVAFEVETLGSIVRGTYWGSGPVVYLLHGWGGRGDQLASFVEPLRATGHRVVMFDALSHGSSEPGPSGPGRAHAVEFGRALDDVAARFGPARAVVAHSMGSVPVLLALRDGWIGVERLVFISPMNDLATYFDRFGATVGFGPRIRRGLDDQTRRRTGYPVDEFELPRLMAELADRPPTMFVHDRGDRETSHAASAAVAESMSGASMLSTDGLGHNRILRDAAVIDAAVRYVRAAADPDGREYAA